MDEADQKPARDQIGLPRDDAFEQRVIGALGFRRIRIVPGDDVVGELRARRRCRRARRKTGRCRRGCGSTATRVSTAPGSIVSRITFSPVMTAASERVVGMPSANIASLTMYSRSTGPSAARPSPRRENGVGPGALELDVAADAVRVDDFAEQDGAAVAELRHEMPELVAGIGHRDRVGALGDALAGEDLGAFRAREQVRIEPELDSQRAGSA